MEAPDIFLTVFLFLAGGGVTMAVLGINDLLPDVEDDSGFVLCILTFLVWPFVALAALGYGIFLFGRKFGRGVRDLYRMRFPATVVPEARVVKK